MSRILLLTAVGALTITAAACTQTPDKVASNRTIYRAHDTQVGSNIPRSYHGPNDEANDPSSAAAGAAGQQSFVSSAVGAQAGGR